MIGSKERDLSHRGEGPAEGSSKAKQMCDGQAPASQDECDPHALQARNNQTKGVKQQPVPPSSFLGCWAPLRLLLSQGLERGEGARDWTQVPRPCGQWRARDLPVYSRRWGWDLNVAFGGRVRARYPGVLKQWSLPGDPNSESLVWQQLSAPKCPVTENVLFLDQCVILLKFLIWHENRSKKPTISYINRKVLGLTLWFLDKSFEIPVIIKYYRKWHMWECTHTCTHVHTHMQMTSNCPWFAHKEVK